MLRRSLIISASALLTAACAGVAPLAEPPTLNAPVELAAAERLETGAPETDWVASFNNTDLERLVAEAMEANPDVLAAAASLDAARASARSANAARLPSLDASTSVTERDAPTAGASTNWSLGLDASWQADVWGRLSNQARAGVLSAEAAEADFYGARLSIAGAVVQSWFAVIEARQQTALAVRDVTAREDQLEIVDRRFRRGVARSSDVRTARSALATSRATLARRERGEAASRRALEALLGRYPGAAIEAAETLPQVGPTPALVSPGVLLQRRPDVAAAELRLAAAGFSAEAARKALYPRLNLSGGVSSAADNPGDLFDTDALVESVTASLLAPIFRGGALRAERDRAAADARRLAARYVSTVLAAWREAEDAVFSEGVLETRVQQLAVARQEADAALELVERQYASGVATIFELIDAQTRLISAEGQLITARRERADNRVSLHLALAGDFAAGGGLRPEIDE